MNCAQCRAIVDGDMKRCRACINVRAMSISDVEDKYKGWLAHEIIEARSHKGATDDSTMDSGTSGDSDNDAGGVLAESEALAHAK